MAAGALGAARGAETEPGGVALSAEATGRGCDFFSLFPIVKTELTGAGDTLAEVTAGGEAAAGGAATRGVGCRGSRLSADAAPDTRSATGRVHDVRSATTTSNTRSERRAVAQMLTPLRGRWPGTWDALGVGTTGGGVRFWASPIGTAVRVTALSGAGRPSGVGGTTSSISVRSGAGSGTAVGALVARSTSVSGP